MQINGFEIITKCNPKDVTKLLKTFWGKSNSIAHVAECIDFSLADKIITSALENDDKDTVLGILNSKHISLGIKYKNKLIGHSAILIQPWGDFELTGMILCLN